MRFPRPWVMRSAELDRLSGGLVSSAVLLYCADYPGQAPIIRTPIIRVEEMEADRQRNKVDLTNLTISDLGIYASPNAAVKLSTRHNAEGRARTIRDRPR